MNHGSKNFQPSGILQRTILQNVCLITAQANEMEWSSTLSLLTKKYFLLPYKKKRKKKKEKFHHKRHITSRLEAARLHYSLPEGFLCVLGMETLKSIPSTL